MSTIVRITCLQMASCPKTFKYGVYPQRPEPQLPEEIQIQIRVNIRVIDEIIIDSKTHSLCFYSATWCQFRRTRNEIIEGLFLLSV